MARKTKIFKNDFLCLIFYVLTGFLTSAYCTVYRWDEWLAINDTSKTDLRSEPKTRIECMTAGIFWPVYWTHKGCVELVKLPQKVNIEFSVKDSN